MLGISLSENAPHTRTMPDVQAVLEKDTTPAFSASSEGPPPEKRHRGSEDTVDYWDCFDDFTEEDSACAEYSSVAAELANYMKEARLAKEGDPLQWWAANKNRFPLLAQCARKYLCAPPTSVASERAFSVSGTVCDEKRARLSAENVEILVFLKSNLNALNCK